MYLLDHNNLSNTYNGSSLLIKNEFINSDENNKTIIHKYCS
ncbi:hypothetical protein A1OE_1210 [Candidatus Endolissoclinum faulkneri L2]|uniref:Uncharacterized protein n=1 Tax=Candidatus Endolissoclinum faulkneri L2 TaxID=1193729 RepID=K7ZDB8_9PROT|nr:hypothetical protein A1OE_1210 [Candidatus Endolissoclinum faulkneri L2]